MFVVTVDQRGSRTDVDRVPELIDQTGLPGMVRAFDRTAGDEVQAVFSDPMTVGALAVELASSDRWTVGVGVGAVDQPLPAETRSGRGEAFVAARTAVESAKRTSSHLRVEGPSDWCRHAQAAGRLMVDLASNRSVDGREAVALMTEGLTQAAGAARLGISPQAMSLRLRHARWELEQPGLELFARLLDAADGKA